MKIKQYFHILKIPTNDSIAFQQASVMKYTNTYINRNLIEFAVIKVFSDVFFLNIRPGLFSLDNYISQRIVSFNRICYHFFLLH